MGMSIGLSDALIGGKRADDAAEVKARQEELDAQARTDWALKNETAQNAASDARATRSVSEESLPATLGSAPAKAAPAVPMALADATTPATPAATPVATPAPVAKPLSLSDVDGQPTSSTFASKYDAETDPAKRKVIHASYIAARGKERRDNAKQADIKMMAGDFQGAVDFYNGYVKDGKTVTGVKEKDGNTVTATYADGSSKDIQKVALHRMLLEAQKEGSHADLTFKAMEEQGKIDAKIREDIGNGQKGLRDAQAAEARAKAKSESGGGLTLPQKSNNAEIDAARSVVGGMSPQEIKLRTSKATDTGRENADYDPNLERQVRLANSRKVGADEYFDQTYVNESPKVESPTLGGKPIANYTDAQLKKNRGIASSKAKAKIDTELTRRAFTSDPSMQGNSMGNQTQHGYEVIDPSGKLIGYWN